MTEAPTPTPAPPAPAAPASPWGADFDPARAWALVENLRADLTKAKADRDAARASLQEREAELATVKEEASATQRALWQEKALRQYPALAEALEGEEGEDPATLQDFLTGTTEEEILSRAKRLAAIRTPKAPPAGGGDGQEPPLPGRPKPNLIPGHATEEPPAFDPEALAETIRQRTR